VAGEDRRRLITTSFSVNPYPAYSPTGHIIYVNGLRDDTAIWALPFSLESLQPTGKPFPIAQHGASPAVSQAGTLVYSDIPSDRFQLLMTDRAGKSVGKIGELQRQRSPTLSPDGHKVAVGVEESEIDLWVYDVDRGGRTRLTFDPGFKRLGTWTPRGDQITYMSFHYGTFDVLTKAFNGDGEAKLLVRTQFPQIGPAWSPDGKYLPLTAIARESKADLVYREHRENGTMGEPQVFLKTRFSEAAAQFSADGDYVAYVSDESGTNEVYVRDFPKGANKWQVSVDGGIAPRWRRDGKEIVYVARTTVMAVSVATRPAFSFGTPVRLFEKRHIRSVEAGGVNVFPQYDVSGDGRRFVILDRPGGEQPLTIHVVHNWFEEFRSGAHKQTTRHKKLWPLFSPECTY
jgi:Tol biopolymer transport system component